MKKILLLSFFLICLNGHSQITEDFVKSFHLFYFNINNSDTKYIEYDLNKIDTTNEFSIYNSDGSLFKIIQIPQRYDPTSHIITLEWISETLFDNNPSNIEYLVYYGYGTSPSSGYQARIIREDASILLDEMDAVAFGFIAFYSWSPMIYSTNEGSKLMLDYQNSGGYYQTKVFSLPGNIPTPVQENLNQSNSRITAFPNPNNGSFYINFQTVDEECQQIDLYTSSGKLINTFKSSGGNPLHFYTYGLSNGMYLLTTQIRGINITSKIIIQN
jgi:hypothetical protein